MYRRRGRGPSIGGLLRLIAVPIFLLGLLLLLSPSLALYLIQKLPQELQQMFMVDAFLGGTSRSWAYLAGGAGLWYLSGWLD